eukprot:TRINITY_DN29210_c0_g1_i1.p1 TRINITY_DN29210_c0_g1~~TRINITY_DN29210_c0_g1_i1.p1  ORF type:complete len:1369 (-),score=352.93 TRINITY_DN29210_c0_g1_i1:131-4192(-)
MAADNSADARLLLENVGAEPRADDDTNAEILLHKRKGPAKQAEPEEQPMSKRKRRKMEQLAKKKAEREMRNDVLQELKTVQLTAEQAALMKASQSIHMSRQRQVDMGRLRVKAGLPLPAELKHLRRRKEKAEDVEENGKPDGEGGSSSSEEGGAVSKRRVSTFLAVSHREVLNSSAPAPAVASTAATEERNQPKQKTSNVQTVVAGAATKAPAAAQQPKPVKPAKPKAAAAKADGQAARKAFAPLQPLQPVRVERTERIEEQRARLPAVMVEQEFVEMVLANDVVLVCGDTGCGKSTQIPQFLYEAGLCDGDRFRIAVTQPRRVAAISVSQRVGDELNDLRRVGYQVRYDRSQCSNDMRIKFMTDGILLREVQADFLCQQYSTIVIDEAHERGVNCDILIGLLSRVVQQRRQSYNEAIAKGVGKEKLLPPLRLVIMSATLRLCDFTENRKLFSIPPPVLRIDARTFPVTVHFARRTEEDYIKAAHRSVVKIHKQLPPGTILVFVTGREEVRRLCRLLRQSSQRMISGKEAAEEGEAPEEDEDEEAALEGTNMLDASDDEGHEFDDELPAASQEKAEKQDVSTEDAERPTKKRKLKKGATAKKKAKRAADAEDDGAGGKEEGEANEEAAEADDVVTKEADKPKRTGKLKKKKKAAAAADDAADDKVAVEKADDIGKVTVENADDMEEPEINFNIDDDEDTVTLDPKAASDIAEDAKDAEAKRQKKVHMTKLDKSRTAGGVFKGIGFGEGPLHVLPLFAQLAARDQMAPFKDPPDNARVVVVATNVAETSVTLPNIRYVVDCGHEKRRVYRASSGVSAFKVDRISKASSDQRAGRSGRLGPGHTYRLYSSAAFENHFKAFAPIAMLNTPMDPVLLLLSSIGVPRLDIFPWPTPPSRESVGAATRRLRALGALQASIDDKDETAELASDKAAMMCTPLGSRLAKIPVAPRYGKMLLAAISASEHLESHIVGHACAIVAALSVGNLTCWESYAADSEEQPAAAAGQEHEMAREKREAEQRLKEARNKEAPRWSTLRDDCDGLLWIMGGYAWALDAGEDAADDFCKSNRINPRNVSEAYSLMQQLGTLLHKRLSLDSIGVELELPLMPTPMDKIQAMKLRECVFEGLVDHVAVLNRELGKNAYVCADLGPATPVYVHCASNSYRHRPMPSVMVFNEIISSTSCKPFMRDCAGVDPLALSRRAAEGTCPLLRLGQFLPAPAPRYVKDQDQVMAFVSPSYKQLDFVLPTVEIKVPKDEMLRYKVFARALLEGEVLDGFPPRNVNLLARPSMALQMASNPRVLSFVNPLWEKRVGSRAELIKCWGEDPRFLLEGYLKWVPPGRHDDVRIKWPPMGAPGSRR